ncbi:MAG: ABC transporter permease [Candidatus Eisenbacteria bacterium]|nr:ABC transporter permease [Candidatus Eisenbacteria bacterium]
MFVPMGLQALTRNRMRSALTVLGIVIGVAAVIATLAIGQGARAAVQAQIRLMGSNVLMVIPGTVTAGGAHGMMGGNTSLTPDDAVAIKRECTATEAVAPGVRSFAQVVYGNQNWNTQVNGTTADFAIARQWPAADGVFITDSDVRGAAKVCVLGQSVKSQLFGDAEPIGATIRIKEIPFRVVGVLASKGSSGGMGDLDDIVIVPLTTAQRKLLGITHVHWIVASATSERTTMTAVDQITGLLRQRHRIKPGDNDDFFIRTQLEIASTAEATSKVMTLLLASVAAVSLLVGGIGIMNIMLVSVTERTREIGIRRAIGARRRDILLQFLFESAFLSLAGGALGVALGALAARAVSQLAHWPTMVNPGAVLLAFGFASMVGVFFGFYPARRAAGLDPVDALRYE